MSLRAAPRAHVAIIVVALRAARPAQVPSGMKVPRATYLQRRAWDGGLYTISVADVVVAPASTGFPQLGDIKIFTAMSTLGRSCWRGARKHAHRRAHTLA